MFFRVCCLLSFVRFRRLRRKILIFHISQPSHTCVHHNAGHARRRNLAMHWFFSNFILSISFPFSFISVLFSFFQFHSQFSVFPHFHSNYSLFLIHSYHSKISKTAVTNCSFQKKMNFKIHIWRNNENATLKWLKTWCVRRKNLIFYTSLAPS